MDNEEFEQRVHDSAALAAIWRAIGYLREQQSAQTIVSADHTGVNQFVVIPPKERAL